MQVHVPCTCRWINERGSNFVAGKIHPFCLKQCNGREWQMEILSALSVINTFFKIIRTTKTYGLPANWSANFSDSEQPLLFLGTLKTPRCRMKFPEIIGNVKFGARITQKLCEISTVVFPITSGALLKLRSQWRLMSPAQHQPPRLCSFEFLVLEIERRESRQITQENEYSVVLTYFSLSGQTCSQAIVRVPWWTVACFECNWIFKTDRFEPGRQFLFRAVNFYDKVSVFNMQSSSVMASHLEKRLTALSNLRFSNM